MNTRSFALALVAADEGSAGEIRIGVELAQQGSVLAVVNADDGRHTAPGGGDDVEDAVLVRVAGCHADAAGEGLIVSEEAVPDQGARALKDLDVRPAARVGARDDSGPATAGPIARGDKQPAAEARLVRPELPQQRSVAAVVDADERRHAGAGGGDDVGNAVAVEVADRHADAAREARVVGEETGGLA